MTGQTEKRRMAVMNRLWLAVATVILGVALTLPDAEARRLGGGRTIGAQRNVTAPPAQAVPAKPAQAAPAAAPAAGAAAAAPATTGSKWMPILGGLALGGLLGAMFAGNPILSTIITAMLIGLLVFAAMALIRMLRAPRAPARPLQYAGLGSETVAAPPPSQASGFEMPAGARAQRPGIPAGFDVDGFLRAAKTNFIRLQLANDAGNAEELREFATPEMYAVLAEDLRSRGAQQTDVVTLNADLLEVATEGDRHWASVRFSGLVSEAPGAAPAGFEEVWNLVKPVDGSSGWQLAGIQQMH
jgi:predicted lipid-binding transport protein (Tim44 family)